MLKSIYFFTLSLIGIISFGLQTFAGDFQIEVANIVVSRATPTKYRELQEVHLQAGQLSFDRNLPLIRFDENTPLKRGISDNLNEKKGALFYNTPISSSEIPKLAIEPIEIEFIEKSPFLLSPGIKISSISDPRIWQQTPRQLGLARTLLNNNYIVNIIIGLTSSVPQECSLASYKYLHPTTQVEYQVISLDTD